MEGIILGAGVTGLAAGYKTGWPIFERGSQPGGNCCPAPIGEFKFEFAGGHWIFGGGEVLKFLNNLSPLKSYHRDAGVLFNEIIPYPLQTFLNFDDQEIPKGTMMDWLYQQFGVAQCNLFFFPFNNKYTDGLFTKVIQDDPDKTPRPGNRGYNATFHYPVSGLGNLIKKLAQENVVAYNKTVAKIDLKNKQVFFADGTTQKYDRMISTLPLARLAVYAGMEDVNLPYTGVLVSNIGAKAGPKMPKRHWVYVPGNDYNFFRVGFYTNVNPQFAPEGYVALYVERAWQGPPPGENEAQGYITQVLRQLSELGWITNPEVGTMNHVSVAYTWLYPKHKREDYLKFFKEHDVYSIGRYGKWKFQGIMESINDGLSVEWS
jgi:protoporphyrinogen oxidase